MQISKFIRVDAKSSSRDNRNSSGLFCGSYVWFSQQHLYTESTEKCSSICLTEKGFY